MGCSIASDMNECCLCGLGMPMRSVYRTKYNIQVSIFIALIDRNGLILRVVFELHLLFSRDPCAMTGLSPASALPVRPVS